MSLKLNGVNHDSIVKYDIIDESIAVPAPEPQKTGLQYLAPFFSYEGRDSVINLRSSLSDFDREFGAVDKVSKLGHFGLMARQILKGGSPIQACRLMPKDAKKSSATFGVTIVQEKNTSGEVDETKKPKYGMFVRDITTELRNQVKDISVTTGEAGDEVTVEYLETFIPIFRISSKGRGKYGDRFKFSLTTDSKRDMDVDGKRRYKLAIYKSVKGVDSKQGSSFEDMVFALDPDATVSSSSSAPDTLPVSYGSYDNTHGLPVEIEFNDEFYEDLEDILPETIDLDLLNLSETQLSVEEEFDFSENLSVIDSETIIEAVTGDKYVTSIRPSLMGGDDGGVFDMAPAQKYNDDGKPVYNDGDGNEVVLGDSANEGEVDSVEGLKPVPDPTGVSKGFRIREKLLVDFYTAKIDVNLYDSRVMPCGAVLDAFGSDDVKSAMGAMRSEVRGDIIVYLDLGNEMGGLRPSSVKDVTTRAKEVANLVDTSKGGIIINIQEGMTTDRVKNIYTSGNYELATGIKRTWVNFGSFSVVAGYQAGQIRTMDFSWYPRVIKDEIEIKPLKDASLKFAMRLNETKNLYWMSDDSQYATKYSVLGSDRNWLYTGTIVRDLKAVLAKYAFDPENARGAIQGATKELNDLFSSGYYPTDMKPTFFIFQTRSDKLNNEASCDLTINFPSVIGGFNTIIRTARGE